MAKKSTAILTPWLGLYLDRPAIAIPKGGLRDGLNFRVKNHKLSNLNLGWDDFNNLQLNGAVLIINSFLLSTGSQRLIFASLTDLYLYNEGPKTVSFLTPRYETGTIAVTNASANIVGTGTNWDPELKAGDQIAFGATAIVDPAYATNGGWYTVLSRTNDTTITLTTPYTGATNGAIAYTGRKLFTGTFSDKWDSDTFYNAPGPVDLWMATNGKDDIVKWDGSGTQVTLLPALGFKAKFLTNYKNMMIYGNVTNNSTGQLFPTSIINSDVGDPENVTTGLSEQFQVHGGDDAIFEAIRLADALVIYSKRHAVLCQFAGEPIVFIFREAIDGVGPLAKGLIANFGDRHEFLGADTGYAFDGVQVKEYNSHVWREALRTRDPARIMHAVSHFDDENGDLNWAIPLTTDGAGNDGPQIAYNEHYLEEKPSAVPTPFSRRAFPFTATGYYQRSTSLTWADLAQSWESTNFAWNDQFFLAAFPFSLVGDENGFIYTLGTSQLANGVLLPSNALTGRAALGDGKMRGLLARIYPFASQFAGLTLDIRLRLSDHASGPSTPSASQAFDLDLPEGAHFVTPYRRARYFEIEYLTTGTAWEIEGWDVEVRPGGMR